MALQIVMELMHAPVYQLYHCNTIWSQTREETVVVGQRPHHGLFWN